MSTAPQAARSLVRGPHTQWTCALLLTLTMLGGCSQVPTDPTVLADLVGLEIPGIISLRVVYTVCGAVLLLAGWRLHRLIVALPGFAVAGSLGAIAASYASDNPMVVVLAVLIAGGLGAWLALTLFRLAVFASGALAGILLADSLWPVVAGSSPPIWGILGGALGGGLLILALMGIWLPVLSSALGAVLLGSGLDLSFAWMLGLFAVGILVQFGVARSVGQNAFSQRAVSE